MAVTAFPDLPLADRDCFVWYDADKKENFTEDGQHGPLGPLKPWDR